MLKQKRFMSYKRALHNPSYDCQNDENYNGIKLMALLVKLNGQMTVGGGGNYYENADGGRGRR